MADKKDQFKYRNPENKSITVEKVFGHEIIVCDNYPTEEASNAVVHRCDISHVDRRDANTRRCMRSYKLIQITPWHYPPAI
ncbi:hypothetical protein PUN28_013741 [Cardiocondyla obscurior]|uniref:Uncharacterized protein n=1 Tax=Cardiocondyla obscurior TaxID=286306 RepID=A0AAW2F4E4_9HYME